MFAEQNARLTMTLLEKQRELNVALARIRELEAELEAGSEQRRRAISERDRANEVCDRAEEREVASNTRYEEMRRKLAATHPRPMETAPKGGKFMICYESDTVDDAIGWLPMPGEPGGDDNG
jgi:hypothetical protein